MSTISAEMGGNISPATASKLGGIKVGSGLSVTNDGTLSRTNEVPAYTVATAGKVLTVADDGSLEWDEKGTGGGDAFLAFDFTKWGTRSIGAVSFSENGADFNESTSQIILYKSPGGSTFTNFTVYVDTGAIGFSSTTTTHKRFIMANETNGLIFNRNDHVWGFYTSGGSWKNTQISDPKFFENCTIKIYVDSSSLWHVYKDGELVFEPDGAINVSSLAIGSTENSINDHSVMKKARIYSGNYTE